MEFPRDRLSDLLPDLRTHIISFLPTKEAIKLGVLSTQWRNPCSSLPILEFNQLSKESDDKHKHRETFKNCVYKTLMNHTAHIERFGLTVDDVDDTHITHSDLSHWITLVSQHRVASLQLCYPSPVILPSSLFACSTLRELDLHKIQLTLTSSVRFPVLRKLVLWYVTFCREDQDEDEDKDGDDDLGNTLFSTTIFPMLQSLEISCCNQIHSLSISIPSFIHLRLGTIRMHPKSHFSIPTLQQLIYAGISGIECSADTLSSLRTLRLYTLLHETKYPPATTGTNEGAVLSTMDKIETLHVSDRTVECLSWDQSLATITRSLSFRTLSICFTDMKEYMVCHQENKLDQLLISEDRIMLRHLRQIKIKDFRASDCEVELVSYLVSSASNLEVMTVNCQKEISPYDQMAIDLKLKSLLNVSQNLKLVCR